VEGKKDSFEVPSIFVFVSGLLAWRLRVEVVRESRYHIKIAKESKFHVSNVIEYRDGF
jgi:hypothetical protein